MKPVQCSKSGLNYSLVISRLTSAYWSCQLTMQQIGLTYLCISLLLANMDLGIIEERCLRTTARYIKLLGVWPGQNMSYVRAVSVVVHVMVLVSSVTQISRIVVYWSVDVLLEQLLFLCVPIGGYVKYASFAMYYSKFKEMFDGIISDWQSEKTKEEQELMLRFADRTVLFIRIYLANAYFVGLSFFFVPFIPYMMDIILPLNETRPRVFMYEAYYFVKNMDDHYYEIMVYTIISLILAVTTFIAADTMLIYLVQHSCVMLNLAGYRIRFGLEKMVKSCDRSLKQHKTMYQTVVYAIKTHQRAIIFLNDLDQHFRFALFLQVGMIISTLTVSLLQAASVSLSMDTYQFYAYATAQLVHIFFLTAQGQFIVNEHDSIYRKTWEMPWHTADLKTQLLLILILRQNLNPPQLTAGGLVRLDFDSFSEVVKASVSYFTVLKST